MSGAGVKPLVRISAHDAPMMIRPRNLLLIACGLVAIGLASSLPASAEDAALRPLCPDRPTKSTAPCTLDAGHWQVETDLVDGTFQRSGGVTTDLWLVASPTLKYGVSDRLDLEATVTPLLVQRTRDHAAPDATLSGVGDLYLRAKLNLWGQGTASPWVVSVVPYVKAPVARHGLGNDAWEGGVLLPASYKVNDAISLGFSPEVDLLKDSNGNGRHLNVIQTAGLNWSLPKGWTVSGELWGDWNDDPAGTVRQVSFDLAAALQVGDNVQWDAGLNLGLNHATPGAQVYMGLSRRF